MADENYTYVAPTKAGYDFGRVMSRTFSTIRDNFKPFTLAALLVAGIPYFLINLWPILIGMEGGLIGNSEFSGGNMNLLFLILAIGVIFATFGGLILQASIIHASVKTFRNEEVNFSESIRVAFRYALPILGFGLLMVLGILGGMLLFIIPGIILMLMWYVGVPVMIIENTGVMGAFGRSAELTKNNRWWILLTVIVLAIIGAIASAVVLAIALIFGVPTQNQILLEGAATLPLFLYAVANGIGQSFVALISATGVASVYLELRQIKEGIEPGGIAAVFD